MLDSARNRMAKHLYLSCPKYNGYLGIVVPAQAINGRCLKYGYRSPLQSDRRRVIYSLAYIILLSVGVSFVTSSLAQSGKATLFLKVTGLRSEKEQVNRRIQFVREMARRTADILVDD